MTPKKKKSTVNKDTESPSLSSNENKNSLVSIDDLEKKVFDAINNVELQKSLNEWEKKLKFKQQVNRRDLSMLKDMISEYMSTFLLFGYSMDDDRVIVQKFENARDRDAIMEFLKTIFIKQQTENFLD
jgi:Holliday junction resolvasome RuvABC DNA-binding subunit